MNAILDWLLQAVHHVDPVLRVLLASFAMFCETSILLGLVIPGDTIVLVSGTAVDGPVQYIALVVGVVIGSLGGESVGFLLGRTFGPRIRHSRLGRRVGERYWSRAEVYLERRGGIAVAISRYLPVFHALVPLVVGSSHMRYRTFLAWTAPACTLWALVYVSLGAFAAGSYRKLEGTLSGAGFVLLGIVVVGLALSWFIRRMLERNEAKHMQHPDEQE